MAINIPKFQTNNRENWFSRRPEKVTLEGHLVYILQHSAVNVLGTRLNERLINLNQQTIDMFATLYLFCIVKKEKANRFLYIFTFQTRDNVFVTAQSKIAYQLIKCKGATIAGLSA